MISSSYKHYSPVFFGKGLFKQSLGFTLLELLTIVTLIGLLTLYMIPRIDSMYDRALIKQKTAEIDDVLRFARFSATIYQQKIAVCGSSDGISCMSSDTDSWSFAIVYPDNLTPASMLYVKDLSNSKLDILVNNIKFAFDRFGFVSDNTFFTAQFNNREDNSKQCLMTIKVSGQINSYFQKAVCL